MDELSTTWAGGGPFTHVYDPTLPGQPRRYLNDHTLIKGKDGLWHLFSIVGFSAPPGEFPDGAKEDTILHATAATLGGPWATQRDALTVDPNYYGEDHLWAPYVIEHNGTYYMYYAAGADQNVVPGAGAAINLATSTDLYTWKRHPSGPLFRGLVARDPMVLQLGDSWVMYYCEIRDWRSNHLVCFRTSTDLVNWSEPGVAWDDPVTDAEGVSITESPFVVARDGWYYLFLGPRQGYEGTDVFRSNDPLHFDLNGYAGHVPAHAAEIVPDGGRWTATAVGVFHEGLYLAPLHWQAQPPPWQSFDNPVAALDVQGQLNVFALDAGDHSMLRKVLIDPDGDRWSDWETFGTPAGAVPTLGRNADGRLEVFSLAQQGSNLHHRVQNADGSWEDWTEFGGPAGAAPAVARNADGRLEVFALGPAGEYIANRFQTDPGSSTWSEWYEFGGPAGAPPVVAANAEGRLEAFALSPGGKVIAHRWQNEPNGTWSDWNPNFGTAAGAAPRVVLDGSGRLVVAAIAPSGIAMYYRQQDSPGDGWKNWEWLFPMSKPAPTLVASHDGRLEAFAVSPGGERLMHRWQTSLGGGWANFEVFGEPGVRLASTPTAAADILGRIHVFAVALDGTVRTRRQTAPSNGWGPWQSFGARKIAPISTGQPT